MKKSIVTTALMIALFFTSIVSAQVGIGVSPANINPSAQLDVSSTTKGFLPPRMTQEQRTAISNPAAGLVIWCSNCGSAGEMQVYNGSAWTNIVGGAAASAPLVIGQVYQGGKIAYIDATGLHGLIAATADLSNAATWWNGAYIATYNTSTDMGTGLTNTNIIISSQGNTGSYAAKICRDYRGGNYADWFLPSKDELNKLYINRVSVGGFTSGYYWSSSAYGDSNAWFQSFRNDYNGYQNVNETNYDTYVRAIRSF